MPERKETKLSLALLDSLVICGQCGAIFLSIGWSNTTHLEWHRRLGPQDAPTRTDVEDER